MKQTKKNLGAKTGTEKRSLGDRIGNLMEKAGHKLAKAGAPGLGQKIHDMGDRMETKHKNPNHPHKA